MCLGFPKQCIVGYSLTCLVPPLAQLLMKISGRDLIFSICYELVLQTRIPSCGPTNTAPRLSCGQEGCCRCQIDKSVLFCCPLSVGRGTTHQWDWDDHNLLYITRTLQLTNWEQSGKVNGSLALKANLYFSGQRQHLQFTPTFSSLSSLIISTEICVDHHLLFLCQVVKNYLKQLIFII